MDKIFKEYPDIVGIKELRKMLNIGKNLAYKIISKGEIPSKKIGRDIKIKKSDIIKYINKGNVNDFK